MPARDTGARPSTPTLVLPVATRAFPTRFAGLYHVRGPVLRSVDKVVRELRLGNYGSITHQALKQKICEAGMLTGSKSGCMNAMKIWMQPINTGTFAMGSTAKTCVDKASDINTGDPPANEYAMGTDNDIMLVRICMKEWPMFPTSAISVKMPTDSNDGSVSMVVTSVFVYEPG